MYLCNQQSRGRVRCQVYAVGKKVVWQSASSSGSALVTAPTPSTAPATTPPQTDTASICSGLGYVQGTPSFDHCFSRFQELNGFAPAQPVEARAPRPAAAPPSAARSTSAVTVAPPKPQAAPPPRPAPAPTPQYSETDPDALTCQRYGYSRGKPGFADCMMQIDMARQTQAWADADYANQMAAYRQQQAAAEQRAREDRELRQLQMLFGIMAGVGARGPAQPAPYAAPPPPPSTTQTFRLPNGNQVYCQTIGGYTSCR